MCGPAEERLRGWDCGSRAGEDCFIEPMSQSIVRCFQPSIRIQNPLVVLAVRARACARAVARLRGVVLALGVGRGRTCVLPLDILPVLRAVLLTLGVGRDVGWRLFGLIRAHLLSLNKLSLGMARAALSLRLSLTRAG